MTSFSKATFWSSFLPGKFSGSRLFSLSCCRTLSPCAASMLLNCNAAPAVSSFLRLNLSTCFFIAYSFPIFGAHPNKKNSDRVGKVAPNGKTTSLQTFFTIVLYTSSTSCINDRTTAANIFSVIWLSGKPVKSLSKAMANSDGHLSSVQEGSLLLILSTLRIMDAARQPKQLGEFARYHWFLGCTQGVLGRGISLHSEVVNFFYSRDFLVNSDIPGREFPLARSKFEM